MYSGIFDLPWWGYVLVALGFTHITIASVTIFLHRHQAHRALDLHPLPSHFFRLWLWLTTGMVTREWAAIHRKHHAKCESGEDPHSPQVMGLSTVLWTGAELYRKEAANPDTLARYGHGTPNDWLEHHVYRHSIAGIGLMLILNIVLFGPIGLTIWAVQMAWIPFWAAGVINGLGHFWGYRNFECPDASTNLLPWGILIGGEELHNNHHSFASSAKLSVRWYEFDIGWMYIRILSFLRLATVKKTIPSPRFIQARLKADEPLLEAILTHRYDVMRRYGQSLQRVCRSEIARLQQEKGAEFARFRTKVMQNWVLSSNLSRLGEHERHLRERLLSESRALATVVSMRDELSALWERSNASVDELVKGLENWITRAEASGIAQLEAFSKRLRSYAL